MRKSLRPANEFKRLMTVNTIWIATAIPGFPVSWSTVDSLIDRVVDKVFWVARRGCHTLKLTAYFPQKMLNSA